MLLLLSQPSFGYVHNIDIKFKTFYAIYAPLKILKPVIMNSDFLTLGLECTIFMITVRSFI